MLRLNWSRGIALALIAQTLFAAFAATALAQERPRRVPESSAAWPASITNPASGLITTAATREPLIRIGLSTSARAVSISTSDTELTCEHFDATAEPLAVARVRIEARNLSPLAPAQSFTVELSGFTSEQSVQDLAREVRERTNETAAVIKDSAANAWKLQVGTELSSRAEADELRLRLEDSGYQAQVVSTAHSGTAQASKVTTSQQQTNIGSFQRNTIQPASARTARNAAQPSALTALAPSREIAVLGAKSGPITSRAPLVFGSQNSSQIPIQFEGRPYRGQLEVFANTSGALTVVNVVSLEDYVLGVVPNELSPGIYPALEALKAQAIAARTYALKNLGQFKALGFDLLPTTRSQVYKGYASEQPLATRAVLETRGVIATYDGKPINAYYTSTCGGRTENGENIFDSAEPYLVGRECALEGRANLAPFTVNSSRDLPDISSEGDVPLVRMAALLTVHGFQIAPSRLTTNWMSHSAETVELRSWLATVARYARTAAPSTHEDLQTVPVFASALALTLFGEARADTLLDTADVDYLLGFPDAHDIPAAHRADVALLVREGIIAPSADGNLHPRDAMSRARVLSMLYQAMDVRALLQIQRGATKASSANTLILRSAKGRDVSTRINPSVFLFRLYGNSSFQVSTTAVMGNEAVTYHLGADGAIDFLELRPAASGASTDRFSNFTNWVTDVTLGSARNRLARWTRSIGTLQDLRVVARGSSRRVIDLELVGNNGSVHLRGGVIRSALQLQEQLFVIDRRYDDNGGLSGFRFIGRGLGHGVGLCQVGAYGMARAGMTYDNILKAYYTGIELTRLY